MKKIISLALLSLLITSCTTTTFFSRDVYFLDFRPYAEKGFLMSTTTVGEKYITIGELNISCNSGYIKQTEDVWNDGINMTVNRSAKKHNWTIDEVLNEVYEGAKARGANGVINIQFASFKNGEFFDYEISGLAVKLEK